MTQVIEMRVLLTGASSFTGAWIAKELSRRGMQVIAPCRHKLEKYSDIRRARLDWIADDVDLRFGISFGDENFIALLRDKQPDILGLHGAELTNYRSWNFDALAATAANTHNIREIFEIFHRHGRLVIATGTIFEPFEGIGDLRKKSFNPYGLSKHFSFEMFRMEAERIGLPIAKFVIPNPFGPWEEPRFTAYLVRENMEGRIPLVATPHYVRDNIAVDLLAAAYGQFVNDALSGMPRLSPSGYIESQGAFANRFVHEVGQRLGRNWVVDLANQTDFSEPVIRVNDMPAARYVSNWSEKLSWDAVATYYS